MVKYFRRAAVYLFICMGIPLYAVGISVPQLTAPVVDLADLIPEQEEQQLNAYLMNLSDNTGTQIAVLTVQTLDGYTIEEYSIETAQTWGLGQKGQDNGALLTVAFEEREVRIESGYGLEALLTDAKCGQIIRNIITPSFKNGEFARGILSGVQAMAIVAVGEESAAGLYDTEPIAKAVEGSTKNDELLDIISVIIIVTLVVFMRLMLVSPGKRNRWRIGGVWIDPFIGGTYYGGRRHSRENRSSGGSFRSFGGSFKGGGGSFGGGGASGKW